MLASSRQKKIIQLINKHQGLSVQHLSKLLGISLNTVRSDINSVIKNNPNIKKTHGGIILVAEPKIDIRYERSLVEKEKISQIVTKHLLEYDNLSLFIDSSTTTYFCIKSFLATQKKATLITNAVDILLEIKNNQNVSVIACGGIWWGTEHCFIGSQVEKELLQYQADIAIIGTSGLIKNKGLFNGNIETVKIKQLMTKQSREVWIVCESSKFDTNALTQFLEFSEITKIFSDKRVSQDWEELFIKNNIQYFYEQ
ncbi:MAG: DeoR/GlpR family DNA-binding transcription regulator [Brevinema sp.]